MNITFTALTITKIAKKTPSRIKAFLRFLNVHKLIDFIGNKYTDELSFQAEWADEFKANKEVVLSYWKKYRFLDEIVAHCKIDGTKKVLDVGCGISTVLHFLPGEKHGVDPLATEYRKLYDYPRDIDIQKSFGENISFNDKTFDVVFCTNVLDHVSNPEKTIREISRVLKVNGYFVLTVEIFKERVRRNPAHPYCLTKEDARGLVKRVFSIVLEKESPWIGMRNYVHNKTTEINKELILIMQKK